MAKTYVVEYDSNNSGGSWWLKEKDWLALEKAGWAVEWGGLYFCGSEYDSYDTRKAREKKTLSEPCENNEKCPGHSICESLAEAKALGIELLGAYATGAKLTVSADNAQAALTAAIKSFEQATSQEASDEGCNCCGAPHSFSTKDSNGEDRAYASGEDVLPLLFEHVPGKLRDACR